jgi:hypothetical protein
VLVFHASGLARSSGLSSFARANFGNNVRIAGVDKAAEQKNRGKEIDKRPE